MTNLCDDLQRAMDMAIEREIMEPDEELTTFLFFLDDQRPSEEGIQEYFFEVPNLDFEDGVNDFIRDWKKA